LIRSLSSSRRLRLVALVLLVVFGASGCRVHTEIGVTVNENGSGSVTVRIGLDDDALRRAPNFVQALKTDDLKAAGWTVVGPVKDPDNFTYLEASKSFANPDEANKIFTELSGNNGPFRDFALTKSRSFARTKFTFHGTVDFTAGLESFSDSEVASQLDGKPLGDDLQAIQDRLGEPLDNVFQFRVAVRLPGDVTSNAPGQAANGAIWQPRLSDPAPVQLTATSTSTRWVTVIGTLVAAIAGVVLLLLLVLRLIFGIRKRHRARHAA
jgi:hypothetical protein